MVSTITQIKEPDVRINLTRIATFVVAAAAVTLTLTACGGGGGGGSMRLSDSEIDQLRSDPRVIRYERIIERSVTLLMPGMHFRYAISAEGFTEADSLFLPASCSGTHCVTVDGSEFFLQGPFDPEFGVNLTGASLGTRGGFDTAETTRSLDLSLLSNLLPDGKITDFPSGTDYGFWGEYGAASVVVLDGPMAGSFEGISFEGDLKIAASAAMGDITATNPRGIGSATWRGIAEAASTVTFERRQGSAVLTIVDLSQPRVRADIEVEGYTIGSPAWADIPLYGGWFGTGIAGRDYLEGNFHGPDHSETYGVFDTGAYIGAFGAKRN